METVVIRTAPCKGNPTGAVTINKSDFDPSKHQLFDAPVGKTEEEIAAAKKAEEDEAAKKAQEEEDAKKEEAAADSDGGKASSKKRGNR